MTDYEELGWAKIRRGCDSKEVFQTNIYLDYLLNLDEADLRTLMLVYGRESTNCNEACL